MGQPYRKDLSHLTWDEVFARQSLRVELVDGWFEALQLKPGACVLDIGAGPGYVSLELAERVGPDGLVCAVDRSAEALAYLAALQRERGVTQIQCIVAEASTWDAAGMNVDAALVTMVLHHADDPLKLLANLGRILPMGAPLVIGEFHPQGPCEVGPPQAVRIAPERLKAWSEAAGFEVLGYNRQTPEHYMFALRRS
jgi:ubiquinone/menaquinone biosynthesis C-methylase UbiE